MSLPTKKINVQGSSTYRHDKANSSCDGVATLLSSIIRKAKSLTSITGIIVDSVEIKHLKGSLHVIAR